MGPGEGPDGPQVNGRPPWHSCVTLDTFFDLSVLPFLIYKMEVSMPPLEDAPGTQPGAGDGGLQFGDYLARSRQSVRFLLQSLEGLRKNNLSSRTLS